MLKVTTASGPPKCISVNGQSYLSDAWTNVPEGILSLLPRKLHLQPSHPISLTRSLIASRFPSPIYKHYNELSPIVTVDQNFDSLDFPPDHPGRSKTDTYYLNADTVLRTHTSAHEVDIFRTAVSDGYTISADVYRRDAIDRTHYPAFHQMEGSRLWDRRMMPGRDVAKAVWEDFAMLAKHDLVVEDPNPPTHEQRNPLQSQYHSLAEVEAIATHLKRSLELVFADIFDQAKAAALHSSQSGSENKLENFLAHVEEPLKVRWVEAYFPFTSPSWELEIFWQGEWLEVLGCGVTNQTLLINAGVPDRLGWAFGLGLERIAMLLFSIPDIRLFWSQDERFLSQFSEDGRLKRFTPFSKYPACLRDISFWVRLPGSGNQAGGDGNLDAIREIHENDVMEIVREVAGDLVEDVKLIDEFQPQGQDRKSYCFRITYRSLERTLLGKEATALHQRVGAILMERLGVEMRYGIGNGIGRNK